MNFRRGFLRLWAVGSVVFVVVVGLFSFGQVASEFERSGQDWSKFPTLIPVDCRDARGKSGIDYEGNFFDRFDQPARGSDPKCWYKINALRRLYPEYNDLADDVVETKLYQKAAVPIREPAAPWKTLGIVSLVAIGVPMLVLFLGAALAWVLSGFAAPRSPTT
jgi:hypothetical protein